MILSCMRINHPALSQPRALHNLNIRELTAMQTCTATQTRMRKMQQFIQDAYDSQPPANAPALLLSAFRQAWQLPWENTHKETYWRVSTGGLAMYGDGRYSCAGQASDCLCCTGKAVSRMHYFWECPLAKAVIAEMQKSLGPTAMPISRAQLWLLQAPPGVAKHVWMVAGLAALNAMNKARRYITAVCMPDIQQRRPAGSQHSQQQELAAAPPPAPLQHTTLPVPQRHPQQASQSQLVLARLHAISRFRSELQDFTSLHAKKPPAAWTKLGALPANHPFIRIVETASELSMQLAPDVH